MIAVTPIYNPANVNRPIQWETFTSINTTTSGDISFCEVTVTVDGVNVGTQRFKPYLKTGAGPVYVFAFAVNVAKMCADLKAPKIQTKSSCFGDMSSAYSAAATDCSGTVQLTIDYYYIDSAGAVTLQIGWSDTTAILPFFIAALQHEENQALTPYVPFFASGVPMLTKAPTTQNICSNNSLFMSTISGTGIGVRVITYDSSDVQIDLGVFSAPAALGNAQVSFGVGPNEIRNTTFDLAGSVNIDDPTVAYYTVAYGSGAIFFEYTAVYRFDLMQCDCDLIRLHWLNRLGGTDAYTFTSLNELGQKTTSETGQKCLNWDTSSATPHNINDGGTFKYNSKAVLFRTMESSWLSHGDALWLSSLFQSGEVYLETTGGLVRVVVADSTKELSTNNTGGVQMVRFNFKITDSNGRLMAQN